MTEINPELLLDIAFYLATLNVIYLLDILI